MFDSWVRKIPQGEKWQPTPVLLAGKSHGQRSLVGYIPWGHKESDTTEPACTHTQRDSLTKASAIPTWRSEDFMPPNDQSY